MNITEQQKEAIRILKTFPETRDFIEYLKDLVRRYADVRNITDMSVEAIKGRQIACDLIEVDIISRFLETEKASKLQINEEYE